MRGLLSLTLALAACGELPDLPGRPDLGTERSGLVEVPNFGSNPGSLRMFTYIPSTVPAGSAPLVVAMHGCTQGAADYANAGWNDLADRLGFYVVYPQIDGNYGCLHWFMAGDTTRDSGEALSIKQMVDKMKATYAIDASRVFVTGLSSGGAMTAAMLAVYPDVFAAGAPIAGIPYGCDTSCMTGGKSWSAQEWGDAVRRGYPGYTGKRPRVSIWQGTSDTVVAFANFGELIAQWTNANGIDATADSTETVATATHRGYADGQGATLVESWELSSGGHGAPIDPPNGCGKATAYMLSVGLCSSDKIARFFGLYPAAGADAGPVAGPDAGAVAGPDAGAAAGEDAGPKPQADAGTVPPPGDGCGCGGAGGPGVVAAIASLLALLRAAGRARASRRAGGGADRAA